MLFIYVVIATWSAKHSFLVIGSTALMISALFILLESSLDGSTISWMSVCVLLSRSSVSSSPSWSAMASLRFWTCPFLFSSRAGHLMRKCSRSSSGGYISDMLDLYPWTLLCQYRGCSGPLVSWLSQLGVHYVWQYPRLDGGFLGYMPLLSGGTGFSLSSIPVWFWISNREWYIS